MATDGSGAPDKFEAGDIVGVVRVPGGDTPIEANIGRSVQRGPFIAEVATWVRGAQPRSVIHLKRSRLQVET